MPVLRMEAGVCDDRTEHLAAHRFTQHEQTPDQRVLPIIAGLATGTPAGTLYQKEAAEFVADLPYLRQHRQSIGKLYRNTKIDTRQMAFDVLSEQASALCRQSGTLAQRMALFHRHAVPLAVDVAGRAMLAAAEAAGEASVREQIRLFVFVSSTGILAPGIDSALIEQLGLRRDTARTTVTFMGCAAALNGLRVAGDHVRAWPSHQVLLVCLELSSVNVTFEDTANDVLVHSIFSDGCAAAVIAGCGPGCGPGCGSGREDTAGKLVMRAHHSHLVDGTADGIVLGLNDDSVTCQLSPRLPDYIESGLASIICTFLESQSLARRQIDWWAVHPGGARIIEKVQASLGLSDHQLLDSWAVLRRYGNMLSPTVLFVIERMLAQQSSNATAPGTSRTGLAFSFAPGLGVEALLFEQHG